MVAEPEPGSELPAASEQQDKDLEVPVQEPDLASTQTTERPREADFDDFAPAPSNKKDKKKKKKSKSTAYDWDDGMNETATAC